jgi:pyruvate ferredoxin oxidoreductase alpha subunit
MIPNQNEVDKFLPPFETANRLDMNSPKGLCDTVGPDYHAEIRFMQQQAYEKAKELLPEIDEEFGAYFGRYYHGLIEEYKTKDAAYVLVAMGRVVGTIRTVVDQLREAGEKAGLIKVRSFRPFPKEVFQSMRTRFCAVGVIDRNISFGYEGALFTEIKAAMYGSASKMVNFIAGLGGRDISKSDIKEMFGILKEIENKTTYQEIRYSGMKWEI